MYKVVSAKFSTFFFFLKKKMFITSLPAYTPNLE